MTVYPPVPDRRLFRPREATSRRGAALATLALLLGALLLLWRPAASLSLDRLATQGIDPGNGIETTGATFPGSAYFFAQDAYAPLTAGSAEYSPHVTMLRASLHALPAAPYIGLTALARYRALNCLTAAIYYEAANEPTEGQRAVAQVVLNRVRHPLWPDSVCGVVYQGSERGDMLCQFTFSCDGSMLHPLVLAKWERARRVAQAALGGAGYAPVGLATYYHTLAVLPGWAPKLDPVAIVGAHIFYQMRGANGTPAAFTRRYIGVETISGPAPRPWKPVPLGAIPDAMPYLPETVGPSARALPPAPLPGAAPARETPPLPSEPARGWTAPAAAPPERFGDHLPHSDIRPEYRDSGRPIG